MLLVYSTNTSPRCRPPAAARPSPTTTDPPITSTSASTPPDPAGARPLTPTNGSPVPYCAAPGSSRPPARLARPPPVSHRTDRSAAVVVVAGCTDVSRSVMIDVTEVVRTVFSGLSALVIEDVGDAGEVICVRARTRDGPVACPGCGAETARVHEYHERTAA